MKLFLYSLILIVMLVHIPNIFPQQLIITQQEKDEIISYLDSTDFQGAINTITDYKILEAREKIEQVFWDSKFSKLDQLNLLDLLYEFNSSYTHSYALDFIDSLYMLLPDYTGDLPSYLQAMAAGILVKLGDNSKVNLFFNFVDEDSLHSTFSVINILAVIMDKVPEYKERAKNELIKYVKFSDYNNARYAALMPLYRKYGTEILSLMLEVFIQDEDANNRQLVLDVLIECCKTEVLHTLLKERLRLDANYYVRYKIMSKLLGVYGKPEDYKFVLDYLPNEQDPKVKEYRYDDLSLYKPPKPNSNLKIEILINDISNQTDTIFSYTWLGDQQFKDELQSILQSAKSNLQAGDSVACAVKVKEFQDEVDFVYKDSLNSDPRFVTIEGWKFLYWNAQYILDRLPEPPVVVTLTLEVINPAMSLVNPGSFTMEVKGTGFTTNSVVYFNGNSRATTFISDSVLNTQILSTDLSLAGNFPVWVSDNSLNSDTLIYKVVSTLPQPVRPVLECVTNNGDGTYTAFFGYKNDNDVSVYIPIGSRNKFTPNPQDRGQTRVFLPGRHNKVYTVIFNGSNLVWTLNGRTSTASANSAPCQ